MMKAIRRLTRVMIVAGVALIGLLSYMLLNQADTPENPFSSTGNNDPSRKEMREDNRAPRRDRQEAEAAREHAAKVAALVREMEQKKVERIYSLFSENTGTLTTGAAEAANLTAAERLAVAPLVEEAWAVAAEDFRSRAVLNERKSDDDAGIFVYDIPARRDRGKQLVDDLQQQLEQIISEEKRKVLINAFGQNTSFGSFGKHDVRVEIYTTEDRYQFQSVDPATGEVTRFGSGTIDSLSQRFAGALDSYLDTGSP